MNNIDKFLQGVLPQQSSGSNSGSGGNRFDNFLEQFTRQPSREDDAYNEIVKAAEKQRQEAAANSVSNTASVLANGGTEKKEPEPGETESDFEKRRRELNPEGLTQEQYKQRKKEEYWAAKDEKARARNQAKADEADKVLERYKDLPREQWTDSDYYAYNKALSDSKNRNAGAVRPGQLLKSTVNRGLTAADEAAAATFDFLVGGPIEEIWSLLQASTDRDLGADPLKRYREREAQVQAANAAEQEQAAAGNTAAQQVAKYGTMAVQSAPQAVMALMTMGGSAGAQFGTEGLQAAATLANSSQAAQRIMPIINGAKNMIRDPNWLSAFGMTSGTSYEDALANGATEDQAAIYALLNGAFNATIETGGLTGESGLQGLPDEIQNALARGDKSAVLEFSKSLGSEILEEVEQGVAENALRRTYDPNTEVYSTENENAVINPNRMRDEAVGAAITTALLGGGQSLAVRGLNTLTNTDTAAQQQAEPAAPESPAQPVTGQQALENAAGILPTQQEAAEAPEASQDIPAPQAAVENTTAQSDEFNNTERPSSFLASVKEKLKNLVLPNERKAVIDKMSFGEQVAGIENGQISRAEKPFLNVSPTTPQTLIDKAGASQLPVIMSYEDAYLSSMDKGKQKGNYHNLGADIMAQIPTQMDTPLAIIKQDNGRIAEVLPVKDKAGKNLYVVVELNAEKGIDGTYRAYNLVISAFGANSNYIQNRINDPNATVIENNLPGAASQVNPQRNTLPGVVNEAAAGSVQNIYSDNNIPQSAANSNTQSENTPTKQKPVKAREVARRIRDNSGTSMKLGEIQEEIQGIADYVASNNDGNGVSSEELNDRVNALAAAVVSETKVDNESTGDRGVYDALRGYLKDTRIRISDELRGDIADFNDWRRRNGFKLKFSKDGRDIDSVYAELSETMGEGLFPLDVTAHADQLNRILEVLDMSKPEQIYWANTVSDAEYNAAVQDMAGQIMDAVMGENIRTEAQDPRFSDSGYLESLDADAPPDMIERGTAQPSQVEARGRARERGFAKNVRESSTTEENLAKSLESEKPEYRQLGNKDVLAKAQEIFDSGLDSARSAVDKAIANSQAGMKLPPEMVPLSRMVANELSKNGDTVAARRIISDISAELTAAGELSQVAKLLRNTDPQTAMASIEKALANVNKEIEQRYGKRFGWKAELTEAERDLINSTDFTKDGAYETVYEQVAERLGQEMPSTLWEKVSEIRRIGMLLRPRTQIKNVLSNVPMLAMRKGAEKLNGAIQDALVKSGKLEASKQTRTAKVSAETKQLAREYTQSHKKEILEGGNKADMDTLLNKHRTIFKNSKVAEGARQLTYKLLESGDAPFVISAYQDSLAQFCESRGIKSAEEVTQDARDFAFASAMEATYKAENVIAQSLNTIKRKSGLGGKALDIIIPFTTTPANITSLMMKYSPIGLANSVYKAFNGDILGAVDAGSKGIVGSAVIALGLGLRALGAAKIGGDDEDKKAADKLLSLVGITGANDSDTDKAAFDRANGISAYSFGGKWSYDWAEPAGSMLALGAEIYDSLQGDEAWYDLLLNSMYTAGDAVLNMSLFQNVTNMLKGYGSNTEAIAQSILQGGATQLLPGLAGDIARIIDGTQRSTYTGGNALDDTLAKLKASTPEASKSLPVSRDTMGREIGRGSVVQRLIDNLVNPGTTNRNERSEISNSLYGLFEETGNKNIFPDQAKNTVSIDGTKYKLNGEEKSTYQKTLGETYTDAVSALLSSGQFDSMSTSEKEATLLDIKSYAADQAKRELAESRGVEYTSDWDDEAQLENPEQYLAVKNIFKLATKDGQPMDYSAIDALVKAGGDYSKLDQTAKALLNDSSTSSRLDDLAAASRAGIDSESWYHAKDIHDAFVDAKDFGSATNKANAFARWLASQDYTQNQQKLLRDQMGIYFTQRANQDTYNKLTGEYNVSADSAEQLTRDMANITPLPGKDTATNQQKLKAIATADYMKNDEERWQAFYSYAGNLKTVRKEADAFRKRYPNGTYAEFVEYSKYINTAGKS